MENEEPLMQVLTRLSLSIEEAMKQKRTAEDRLVQASDQVSMLSEANEALMKHVASLETRNEIVVNGLLKIVGSVDRSCNQLVHISPYVDENEIEVAQDPNSEENAGKKHDNDETVEICQEENITQREEISPNVSLHKDVISNKIIKGVLHEEEPQSAELRSLRIDPLVNSRINDYAAQPETMYAEDRRRNSNMRSGRLRSSRLSSMLRKSGDLLRRRRTTDSFEKGRFRRPKGVGMRFNSEGIPLPESTCGCFLESIFGCRH